jgi:hypothetical protein
MRDMTKTHETGPFPRRLTARAGSVLALISACLLFPAAARADDSHKNVCLWVNRIDHTQVLNDHQILFYEVGGKVWQNNLTVPCRTLTAQDGFSWRSGIPEFCGNVEQIKVLRTGETCLLGAFVPYVKGGASPVGTTAPDSDRVLRPN